MPATDDTPRNPATFLQLVATRAAESIGSVASRAELTSEERAAFTTTEHVCAQIAVGQRT